LSKESRRRQRTTAQTGDGTTRPAATAGGPAARQASTSPSGTPRAGRRVTARPTERGSFLERYRTLLFAAVVVVVVALAGIGIFSAASTPLYACSNTFEPAASAPPQAGASPQPGYVQDIAGGTHVGPGTVVTYTYCPPASGDHYAGTGGPITPRAYGPDDAVLPQGWIHNLEHGAMVVLYRGDSEGATADGQAALRAFYDSYPPSPVCGFAPGTSVGPVFARFDEMATPFAAVLWGRVLPLQSLDTAAILEFDRVFGERTNPEDFCPDKRVSPAPSAPSSAHPAASASPSASKR
jgi:Protein of unknown function (DUF3105)